jgi:flagellar hook-associated protein 1
VATFGSILSIARQAITAHRVAMTTVSHNIANAETPGYSRQRTDLRAAYPQHLPFGSVGTGVEIANIVRLREPLLDQTYRREVGSRDGFSLRHELMSEVESVLNEPSDTGLASAMDQFWNSWSDLSNNPGNASVQGVVRQRGAHVATMLNSFARRVVEVTDRARSRLVADVGEINQLTKRVAELNRQITAAESAGTEAPDLRDELDRVADQLAGLAGAKPQVQANGTLGVYIGGTMLVDAANARTLEVRGTSPVSFGIKGDPDPLLGAGGELQAIVDFINVDVPAVQARLDGIAKGLVNGVNEYHTSGWTAAGDALGNANWNPLNGPTGSRVNFFDPAFTGAMSMRLSAEVTADARVIAAGDVQNAPGNTAVALALAGLRDDIGMAALATRMGANFATQIGFAPGESYAVHYANTVSVVGVAVDDSADQFTIFDTLTRQADERRISVSGVSLDEELTLMMQHQQAFAAASRIVRAADEMAQTIINMV